MTKFNLFDLTPERGLRFGDWLVTARAVWRWLPGGTDTAGEPFGGSWKIAFRWL